MDFRKDGSQTTPSPLDVLLQPPKVQENAQLLKPLDLVVGEIFAITERATVLIRCGWQSELIGVVRLPSRAVAPTFSAKLL